MPPPGPATRRILAPAAAACGLLLVLGLFWPGILTIDAGLMLAQGRRGGVWDYNPPLLTKAWGLLDLVWAGAGPVLLLLNLAAWGGLLLLVRARPLGSWLGAALILVVGLCPPVLAYLAQVGKDTAFLAAMSLSAGLLATAEARRSRWALLAAAAAAFGAVASRYNGLVGLIPLGAWGGAVAQGLLRAPGSAGPARWAARLAGVGVAMALAALALLLNRAATDQRSYIQQHFYYYDLTGVAVRTGDLPLPPQLEAVRPDLEVLRRRYGPVACEPISLVNYPPFRATTDPEVVDGLRWAWLGAIWRHPWAWSAHRLDVWRHLLGLYPGPNRSVAPVWTESSIPPQPGPAGRAVLRWLAACQDGLLFRPWAWALLGMALLVRGLRKREEGTVAIAGSGLLYLFSYLPMAPAADLRYAMWAIVSVCLAGISTWPPSPEAAGAGEGARLCSAGE